MERGLRLIQEEEDLVFGNLEELGYEIYYRRIPNHIRAAITKRYTKQGKRGREITDWGPASLEMLVHCIKGWKGIYKVENGKSKIIEFSADEIRWIPDDVQADLLEATGANVDVDLKNLPITPASKEPTKA